MILYHRELQPTFHDSREKGVQLTFLESVQMMKLCRHSIMINKEALQTFNDSEYMRMFLENSSEFYIQEKKVAQTPQNSIDRECPVNIL